MYTGNGFNITFYLQDEEIDFPNEIFSSFTIYEILHLGIYFAKLEFHNISFIMKKYPIISNTKISMKIEVENDDTVYKYDFIVFQPDSLEDVNTITLIPEIYLKLGKDRYSVGYNDQVHNIMSDIANTVGITDTDIENTSLPKRNFLQINQSYFSFIRNMFLNAKSKTANYMFFIDKSNKLKFYTVNYLKSKNEIAGYITNNYIKDFIVKDRGMSNRMDAGFGAKGYQFDWETGNFDTLEFDINSINSNSKLTNKTGVKSEFANTSNSIIMLNTVGKDVFNNKKYNEAFLENSVIRKNMFNFFLNFTTFGILKYSAADLVDIKFNVNYAENTEIYDGKWVIYSVIHSFMNEGFSSQLSVSNPFLQNVQSTEYV